MLKDAAVHAPARIGVLDVGGATLEDVTAWSTWDDPNASRRASTLLQEEGVSLLRKPFRMTELWYAVNQALAGV